MNYKILLITLLVPANLTAASLGTATNNKNVNKTTMSIETASNAIKNGSQNQTPAGETVFLKGTEMHTNGLLLKVGTKAPDFSGTGGDLKDVCLQDFQGKRVVPNIFPSLDTPTCAASVRYFNKAASTLENTIVLCISMDLPFAQRRFCTTEGLDNVIPLSVFRSENFVSNYPLQIIDGPMKGLCARAVIIIDEQGKIAYTELVKEISQEPDYEAALKALK